MKQAKNILIVVLAVLVVGSSFGIGYLLGANSYKPEEDPEGTNISITPENDSSQSESESQGQNSDVTPQLDYIEIATEYGALRYPEQWNGLVSTSQVKEGECIRVSFYAIIREASYPLFEVAIGADDGILAGTLTDSAGTARNVYLSVEEIPEYPELSENEQQRLYAMQEDLNYLIDNLK